MKKTHLIPILFCLIASGCFDSVSFQNVRKLKTGMTIDSVEQQVGKPHNFCWVNDSTETRSYTYDSPGSGIDKHIYVTYQNGRLIELKDR